MAQGVRAHLRYSIDHEWLEDGEPARVGITTVAADALGEVVFVELPEVGAQVEAGEPCGELESTKSVSDLVSPVSGIFCRMTYSSPRASRASISSDGRSRQVRG